MKDGGDPQPGKGTNGLAENVEDPEQGGGESAGVRIFLLSHRPISVDLWCRGVGDYPPHGTSPGGFPRLGGAETYGAAAMAESGWKLVVHLNGGGERGGGFLANGNLHLTKAEYGRKVYLDATNYRPM